MSKKILILGSTGSIGAQTLEVIRMHPGEFEVVGLAANKNQKLFREQCEEFNPRLKLQAAASENPIASLNEMAACPEADLIVNALGGSVGFWPTLAAAQAGKRIALANKESLVMAGGLIMETALQRGGEIIPIDSEPSALWQLKRISRDFESIVLTASGGPFWGASRAQLKSVTPAQAAAHPTWKMGRKVSIDSATLMNKAFEIIEAAHLFGVPGEKIDVSIHRQSIVHSMIRYGDGSMSALLSVPDMRIPITYALFYPERAANELLPKLDLNNLTLTFEKLDGSIFEGPRLAYEVLEHGGIMPAVFCLADELAVEKFIRGEIAFLQIYDVIKSILETVNAAPLSLEMLRELQSTLPLNP